LTRARFAGALAVGALILAACAPARIVAVEGVRAPVAAPAVGVQPPAPQANLQPPAAPEVPPPPLPTMELAEFIGLSPFEVAEVLGDPDLDRKEPTAQVLQYGNGQDCVLHLFLYQSLGAGLFRVEHAEVLPKGVGPSAEADCITALLVRAAAG
jgi:hypothetical protein